MNADALTDSEAVAGELSAPVQSALKKEHVCAVLPAGNLRRPHPI